MDRLICGDVGYGKTEVALRAAFKAAAEGKQVLMLVPTTILAQQHYGTFAERLADYPFTLEHVSRFRTAGRAEGGGRGLRRGPRRHPDRHPPGALARRAREGPRPADRRRGAALRRQAEGAAAPAEAEGRRDLDVGHADPAHAADVARRPARHLRDRDAARRAGARSGRTWASTRRSSSGSAIEREHGRGGQAFFLHNRVESIEETAERLRALCPGVRFAVAHGQMAEGELEAVMMDYLRGGADVLVCTSIIESGIDIPQANTLIVEHADAFGLAQLYQIRGRVGRSRERAYAYLLYDSAAALTPEAAQRLSALSRLHRARRRLQDRDARPRDPRRRQPARRRAVRARRGARLRAVHADARRGRAGRRSPSARARSRPSRCASTSTSTPTCPPTTSPTSRPRSRSTAASPARVEVADVEQLREELEDRFGPVPEPLENLLALQRARIKFGQAGARDGELPRRPPGGRPDRARLGRARSGCARSCPRRSYESGRSQVSVRVPRDGRGALPERREGGRHAARDRARGGLGRVLRRP